MVQPILLYLIACSFLHASLKITGITLLAFSFYPLVKPTLRASLCFGLDLRGFS